MSAESERISKWLAEIDKRVEEKYGPKEEWYCTKVEAAKQAVVKETETVANNDEEFGDIPTIEEIDINKLFNVKDAIGKIKEIHQERCRSGATIETMLLYVCEKLAMELEVKEAEANDLRDIVLKLEVRVSELEQMAVRTSTSGEK